MSKTMDVLNNEIVVGDLVIVHVATSISPVTKGFIYRTSSTEGKLVELIGIESIKFHSRNLIKIMGGLEHIIESVDCVAERIQQLINSRPWSPSKNEIIAALTGNRENKS